MRTKKKSVRCFLCFCWNTNYHKNLSVGWTGRHVLEGCAGSLSPRIAGGLVRQLAWRRNSMFCVQEPHAALPPAQVLAGSALNRV